MAQYPNYFPTQQPYNLYGQQYMPNPYMERMANLQQYQQSLQPQQQVIGITGKVVESIDMVRATDIPMNGETVYFPKADGTEIYTKRWLPNGTTEVIAYKPVLNTQEEQATNTIGIDEKLITSHFKGYMDEVIKRLDGIDARLDNFEQSPTRTKSKTAKEES
jgi:hypothetical protein